MHENQNQNNSIVGYFGSIRLLKWLALSTLQIASLHAFKNIKHYSPSLATAVSLLLLNPLYPIHRPYLLHRHKIHFICVHPQSIAWDFDFNPELFYPYPDISSHSVECPISLISWTQWVGHFYHMIF